MWYFFTLVGPEFIRPEIKQCGASHMRLNRHKRCKNIWDRSTSTNDWNVTNHMPVYEMNTQKDPIKMSKSQIEIFQFGKIKLF